MTWKLIETIEQEVKVELEGGHTAVLRPLTPTELRRADASVSPLDAYSSKVMRDIFDMTARLTAGTATEEEQNRVTTQDEQAAMTAFAEWLMTRQLARLELAIIKLDDVPVTSFKRLIEHIRPVSAASDLVTELGSHLDKILALPDEGKD